MGDTERRRSTIEDLREAGFDGAADSLERLGEEIRRLRNVLAEIHTLAAEAGDDRIADLADRALLGH